MRRRNGQLTYAAADPERVRTAKADFMAGINRTSEGKHMLGARDEKRRPNQLFGSRYGVPQLFCLAQPESLAFESMFAGIHLDPSYPHVSASSGFVWRCPSWLSSNMQSESWIKAIVRQYGNKMKMKYERLGLTDKKFAIHDILYFK